jgi:hypothetical protein
MNRRHDLDQIAAVIMEAHLVDLPVIPTLVEVLDVSPDTARRLHQRARLSGRLRHAPVQAVLHRGSPQQVIWSVCETCTTTWPCSPAKAIPTQ